MRYLMWSLGAYLGLCLCCLTGARAQSPAAGPVLGDVWGSLLDSAGIRAQSPAARPVLNLPAKDLAALVESTRSLLQSQLEADKGLCTFIGSWADFAASMRDKGKPLAEVLTLARQMPEHYVRWIPWLEAMTTEIFTGTLRPLSGEHCKALQEIQCLNMVLQRNRQPLGSSPATQPAPLSGQVPTPGPPWVLWAHDSGIAKALGAWPTKHECEAGRAQGLQKSNGVSLTCLPDTVTPSGKR